MFPSSLGIGKSSKKRHNKNEYVTTSNTTAERNQPNTLGNYQLEEATEPIMKICKYCGQSNDEESRACSSCGANEFSYKCSNCGTVFDNGNYCPTCGVKIGTKAKICPSCGNEYYTNACPNCGFNNAVVNKEYIYIKESAQPKRKRRTWLWVFGWLFIFPLPLTILLVRKKEMNPVIKYGLIAIAWILFLLIGLSGLGNGETNSENTNTNTVYSAFSLSTTSEEFYGTAEQINSA